MNREAGLKTYDMKLKVITPTFIGGGTDYNINKSQYIFDPVNKKLKIIDERKLAKFLGQKKLLGSYLSYIKQLGDFSNKDNRNKVNIGEWYQNTVSRTNIRGSLDECVKYTIDVSHIQKNQLNDIACFIKDVSGMPYIPGSSLKGSIVNAILSREISQNKSKYREYWQEIKKESENTNYHQRKNNLDRLYAKLTKEILDFSIIDPKGSRVDLRGMTGISISDTEPLDRSKMKLFQRVDLLLTDKIKNEIPVFRECLVAPAETNFTLTVDKFRIKKELKINGIEDIMEALNIQFELLAGSKGVFKVFKHIDSMIPYDGNDEGLIFIGGGTGYHTKTIMAALAPSDDELLKVVRALLHRDKPVTYIHKNDKIISPRTLKVSQNNNSMMVNGICRIGVNKNA